MSLQNFKTFLASTKNIIPSERLQGTVFLVGVSKEQYPKTDISKFGKVYNPRGKHCWWLEWIRMDYIVLLKGVRMFEDFWGKDSWYVNHILRCRDGWGNLSCIAGDQIERIIIEFLRYYKVQYTYRIDREDLGKALANLDEHSKILSGRSLLNLNFKEKVKVENGRTTWISQIVKEMYNELCGVHGIGSTSASKILHGINTRVFMMWDQYIRRGYTYYEENAEHYLKFMADCQTILKRLVDSYRKKSGCDVTAAEEEICGQAYPDLAVKKPLAKLLDEYNWMKFCNNADLPDPWLDP